MKFFLLLSGMVFINAITAQNIRSHQWENRLVLVFAPDKEHPDLKKQMTLLKQCHKGLNERKIIVYQIIPTSYTKQLSEKEYWTSTEADFFSVYGIVPEGIDILVIGLDGGIKLRQSTFLTCNRLFGLIDGMPMRKAELDRKG